MAVTTLTLRDRGHGSVADLERVVRSRVARDGGVVVRARNRSRQRQLYQLTRRWTEDESLQLPWFDHEGWRYVIAVPPTVRLSRGTLKLASRNY